MCVRDVEKWNCNHIISICRCFMPRWIECCMNCFLIDACPSPSVLAKDVDSCFYCLTTLEKDSRELKFRTESLGWVLYGPPTTVHTIHECRTLRWLLPCVVLVSPPHHHDSDDNDHHDHHHHQQDPQSDTHTCHHQRCWGWCCLRLCRTLEVWKWSVNITSCKFVRNIGYCTAF